MKRIEIDDYMIHIGDANEAISSFLKETNYAKIVVLVDENTREHCLPLLTEITDEDIIEISSGESHKGLSTCEAIWSQMIDKACDRYSLVLNLGGGVIGDMGGFAASCFMRGVDFVQIPTTLLSQVDASVGGKLAVDFRGLKNIIGMFRNPQAVIVDPTFLHTLPPEEVRSGYAEMLKHALIADGEMWARLTKVEDWRHNISSSEIMASIKIKEQVVKEDPREKGLRKILNFGHTIGHAVESVSFEGETPYLHGEAIALGMVAECQLSVDRGMLSIADYKSISAVIKSIYGDIPVDVLSQHQRIIDILRKDKKHKGGQYSFSLLDGIGHCAYDEECDDDMIRKSLETTMEYWS